ncbi:MAG: ABC transporter substrate-binding protein, partial [Paracoccaceae bacterium]|nr:ABC transporter substrate-binding protein [Paracoccaceae bacterium]
MKRILLSGIALVALTGTAFAGCPPVTVANPQGVAAGAYPEQYELSEFQKLANCKLTFSENPAMTELNAKIRGNPDLPPLSQRLPEEPLVVAPYDSIGHYGGTFHALSNASEAGTSDFLSVRHVNLVRYSDDLQTIVPYVAKSWSWNKDFTQLTFKLRKGHKWSDGAPFTSADVKFWYDNLTLDKNVFAKPKDYALVAGKPMVVETPDPQTVIFKLPAPKPGLLATFATIYAQPFQPKHFLGQFHPKINPDADKLAQSYGFENGYALIKAYYGNSDWTDTGTPMLNSPDKVAKLPKDTLPTLESHIMTKQTTEGRHLVANPYFFAVDTAGNQLPYINEMDETFANENEVRLLKLVNGEVTYKAQSLSLPDSPLLLEKQDKGGYTIDLAPTIAMPTFSFNVTDEDLAKRKIFGDLRFRKAMSLAINREEMNQTAFFGQGVAKQYVGFSPAPDFVDSKWLKFAADYNPAEAKKLLDEVGLKDVDGDGFRELPGGKKLVLNLQFATQGVSSQVAELVAQYWSEVGVKTQVKEVTPDEYRSAQSANKLDIGTWRKGQPIAIVMGTAELWKPPFENYFGHRTGVLWAEYIDSNGKKGVKPPKWVY